LAARLAGATSVTVGLAALGGCMVGPDYTTPEVAVNEHWIGQDEAPTDSGEELVQWWGVFEDPTLVGLVETAYRQNLDLRAAGVRVLQAMAQRGVAIGDLFPQSQTLSGAYARSRDSDNGNSPPGYFTDWTFSFDASWELDVWGKIRRSIESADAELLATIASYDNVMVSLISEVALTYVSIRAFDETISLTQENLESQRRVLTLTEQKFDAGATTLLDVSQTRTLVSNTEADLARLQYRRKQAVYSLAFLLGEPPSLLEERLGGTGTIPVAPRDVAVGAPADLLRRRPDVRVAERTAAAQSALIGFQEAQLYPSFFLAGSIGLDANKFSRVWNTDSWTGFINPGFSWPILNYGRIKNSVRAQDAAFQAAAINYQNTVLFAAQEVESSLAAFLGSQDQAAALSRSVEQANLSYRLSLEQYQEGEADFIRLLQALQSRVATESAYASARSAVASSLISTYKALGGGWQVRDGLGDMIPGETIEEMRERTDWGGFFDEMERGSPVAPPDGVLEGGG
jgi:NodT family efflux transporter outer membrane factor (OMF) lipoprotein